jgi:two-component system, LytTR family, sensor kinase
MALAASRAMTRSARVGFMPSFSTMRTRRVSMLTILVIWSVAALAEVSATYVTDRMNGTPRPLWLVILRHAPGWYAWALMTPAILWLAERFPLRRPVRASAVIVHVVACLAAITIHAAVATATFGGQRAFGPVLLDWGPFTLILYWAVVVAAYAIQNFQRYQEQEIRASALSAELATAQLSALRAQLHPHFLFNALNAAVGLVRAREPEEGVRVLTHLSELLRHLLQDSASQEIPLHEELALLDRYVAIERARFGERLTTVIGATDGLGNVLVPSLVLQPLVENAVRHAVARREAPVHVRIDLFAEADRLHLRVTDDGPGLPIGWTLDRATGVGLSNTRARLAALYGANGSLDVAGAAGGGVQADVTIPLRRSP